jgi:DNA-binding LytR/AlgR family response regulator
MLRSLIVDDEEPARSWLSRLLNSHADIDIAGFAQDGPEAVGKIEEMRPDLLFLDIQLPGLTGFEVLQSVRHLTPFPLVIFATGYDQHALAAFEADALAYLLKPVEPERLSLVLDRARRLHSKFGEIEQEGRRLLDVVGSSPYKLRKVVCRRRDRLVLIPPQEILWFGIDGGIVRAHTATDTYWVNYQLNELEANLPPRSFFRARRDALVNVDRIREVKPYFKGGYLLVMADAAATEIAVSERQVRLFRQLIPGL